MTRTTNAAGAVRTTVGPTTTTSVGDAAGSGEPLMVGLPLRGRAKEEPHQWMRGRLGCDHFVSW
jgi:hypothetical protein